MLHITNGESAVRLMREGGLEGEFLPWDDALHDGPTPQTQSLSELSRVRARFIADCGWAELGEAEERFQARDRTLMQCGQHEEVILWFERDLYDQLQLIQLLDWFSEAASPPGRLSLVQSYEFLGVLKPASFGPLTERRETVTKQHLELGREAWGAFTASEPRSLADSLARDSSRLPYLKPALTRHLQQFPAIQSGLSRTERQILLSVADGISAVDLFWASQRLEESPFMGDWSFWLHLEGLINVKRPLLKSVSGRPFQRPPKVTIGQLRKQELELTPVGVQVLRGSADWIEVNGIDRWLGGAHLTTRRHWRWDESAGRLVLFSA